jgi:hypothetical protein
MHDSSYTAYWHQAEEPIMNKMRGDAITIMDCCFASSATLYSRGETHDVTMDVSVTRDILSTVASSSKSPEGSSRTRKEEDNPSYYLLAATTDDGVTRAPGPRSFTAVLCNALEELVVELDGGPFGLNQLSGRINGKQRNGACLVWDRSQASRSQPQLGRVGRACSMRGKPRSRYRFGDVAWDVMQSMEGMQAVQEKKMLYKRKVARQWIRIWKRSVNRTEDHRPSEKKPQFDEVAMEVMYILKVRNSFRSKIGRPADEKSKTENSGYRKVEVLIIRWGGHVDNLEGLEDIGQDGSQRVEERQTPVVFEGGEETETQYAEIERLQTIFKSGFGYGCTVARIRLSRNPQIDLNFAILQHVREHDGENNLLIVYYSDHRSKILGSSEKHLEPSA